MSVVQFEPRHPDPPARRGPEAVIALADDYWRLAQRVAATEFVPKALRNRPEAVVAALLSGAERGLGPMESLRSINVIEGTPSLSAEAMRALVLAAGHDIDIVESTATRCTINGRRAGSDHTTSFTWTIDRARRARLTGKDNWVKYPESMLLARATTELCRAVFPDVTAGLRITEEVLDDTAPDPATVTRRPPRRLTPPPPAPDTPPPVAPTDKATVVTAGVVGDRADLMRVINEATEPVHAARPATTDTADHVEEGPQIPGGDRPSWGPVANPAQQAPADPAVGRRLHAEITKAFPDANSTTRDRWRHALVAVVTRRRPDGPVTSSNDLTLEDQLALSKLLTQITGGQATVTDGPDDTVELRAGGGWRYTITFDPVAVAVRQGDQPDGVQHLPGTDEAET